MDPKIKAALAIFAGMVAAFIMVFLGENLMHTVSPADLNWEDSAAVKNYFGSMSVGQWAMLLASYFLAGLVGGYLTNWICKDIRYKPALITGVGLLVTTLLNYNSLGGHPTWVWIASVVLIPAAAWIGGRLTAGSYQR